MLRRLLAAVLAASFMAVTGFAGTGNAGVKLQYDRAYKTAGERCGDKTAPGRNVYREGSTLSNGKRVSRAEYRALRAKLDSLCLPQPVAVERPVAQVPQQAAAPAQAAPSGGGCSGMSAESGSLGYNNDTHAGYIGCYQISADHYSGTGSCAGLGTDPAGQDQCAANICATEGPGAWHNSAGQNPCGRLGR